MFVNILAAWRFCNWRGLATRRRRYAGGLLRQKIDAFSVDQNSFMLFLWHFYDMFGVTASSCTSHSGRVFSVGACLWSLKVHVVQCPVMKFFCLSWVLFKAWYIINFFFFSTSLLVPSNCVFCCFCRTTHHRAQCHECLLFEEFDLKEIRKLFFMLCPQSNKLRAWCNIYSYIHYLCILLL